MIPAAVNEPSGRIASARGSISAMTMGFHFAPRFAGAMAAARRSTAPARSVPMAAGPVPL